MSEQAEKWERQWSELLTRCHGEAVEADSGFKSGLLNELRQKMAESRETPEAVTDADDAHFGRLLQATYQPCEADAQFKNALLSKLKSKQAETSAPAEDEALRTILTKSYKPVDARHEFQTRLLEKMKDRQRSTTSQRIKSRRRTIFMSTMSGMAAAAAVVFVVWVMPTSNAAPVRTPSQGLNLIIPDVASAPQILPVAASFDSGSGDARIIPASYSVEGAGPSVFDYKVSDAFARTALPSTARGIRSVEYDGGNGWREMNADTFTHISPGMAFRTSEAAGHIGFDDGTIITMNPDSRVVATESGLSIEQGFLLVSVPQSSEDRFMLHFPERDLAIEPGTDLAVMVEGKGNYAEGGAPAPLVMVVEDENGMGGLALAKGRYGVGPLFAKHVYRLDNYVTPDMPGRMMCDTECQDLENLFKMETVRSSETPMALFAGGFGGGDRGIANPYTTVMTPAGFSKRGSAWVADSYKGEQTVRIRYLSDDYFGLANERRDLSRELALGGEVIVDGGNGVFYEVYK